MTTWLNKIKSPSVVLAISCVSSAAVGSTVTYVLLSKRLEAKYAAISEGEIAQAKLYYASIEKTGELADPIEMAKKYKDEIADYDLSDSVTTPGTKDEIEARESIKLSSAIDELKGAEVSSPTTNIFTQGIPNVELPFDYEAEVATRTEEAPYVVSFQEFQDGEKEYEQMTLTWYDGDGVLADNRDQMIEEIESMVGHDNLEKFGYGSEDKNIVYIRNDRIEADFEVIKHEGKFGEVVMGFDQDSDLKHSNRRPVRKFRSTDE